MPDESQSDDQCARYRLLIAGLNHEMRNSLQAIAGSAELLMANDALAVSAVGHVQTIHNEALVLRRLVDDLLDSARIEAGQMSVVDEPFSPGDVAKSLMDSWRPLIAARKLTGVLTVDDDVPMVVRGDGQRLRQVLTNLVSNAAKYTDRGSIEVAVRRLGESPQGTDLRFEVIDTGPGIPDDAVAGIFEPYQQVRIGDQIKGTGLGLGIARSIVELMGGTLEMETGEAGTHFHFDLCLPPARRADDLVMAGVPRSPTGGRVLVVDDSEINRIVLSGQLRRLGYEPVHASGGVEAIAAIEAEPFDAVMMDVQMPDMDGMEVTRRIRTIDAPAGTTPVIAVTASALTGDRERCLASGMNDFITKPVSIDDLAPTLARWISVDDVASAGSPDVTPVPPVAATDSTVEMVEPTPTDHMAAEVLGRLEAELGDRQAALDVVSVFSAQVPAWQVELSRGSVDEVRLTAHTLTAAARIIGFDELADAATRVEREMSDGHDVPTTAIVALVRELAAVGTIIEGFNIGGGDAD